MKRSLATLLALILLTGSVAAFAETDVSIWTWTPIPRTIEKMITAVEAENPDIKISYTNYNYNPEYLAALAAGAGANNMGDVLGLQPGSLTQRYRDYLATDGIEPVRSESEYAFELLMLGTLWRNYADGAHDVSTGWTGPMSLLARLRQRGGAVKEAADRARGILATVFLSPADRDWHPRATLDISQGIQLRL
jgi:hypothetical protein